MFYCKDHCKSTFLNCTKVLCYYDRNRAFEISFKSVFTEDSSACKLSTSFLRRSCKVSAMMSMCDCIDRATNISYVEETKKTKQKTMALSTIKQKLGEGRCDVKITFICKLYSIWHLSITSLTCLMLGVFC